MLHNKPVMILSENCVYLKSVDAIFLSTLNLKKEEILLICTKISKEIEMNRKRMKVLCKFF